jgi:hypothetical protein
MLLLTHLKIAECVNELTNYTIPNYNHFILGIRTPDVNKAMLVTKHIKENTLHEVESCIRDLNKLDPAARIFSYRLGEMLHYIMDYFTKYHTSKEMYNKLIRHIFHEIRLMIKPIYTQSGLDMYNNHVDVFKPYHIGSDILGYINFQITIYESLIRSKGYEISIDIDFALCVSTICTLAILSNKMRQISNGEYKEEVE